MEIKVKEIINLDEFNKEYKLWEEDPGVHPKPKYEFRPSVVGIASYDIIMYRVLSEGVIESDKVEIHIVTNHGPLTTDYKKELHDELRGIVEWNEKINREYDIKNLKRED